MGDQYRRAASEDHIVWQPFRPHARIIIKLGGGTATRGGEELKSLGLGLPHPSSHIDDHLAIIRGQRSEHDNAAGGQATPWSSAPCGWPG